MGPLKIFDFYRTGTRIRFRQERLKVGKPIIEETEVDLKRQYIKKTNGKDRPPKVGVPKVHWRLYLNT